MSYQVFRPATAFSMDRTGQRKPRQKSEKHLAWVRTLPSLVPGVEPIEAAHVRYADPRYAKPHVGMGEKPSDCWVVPLAGDAHRSQHSMNEHQWWIDKGIDPAAVAALLWLHSGDDEAGRMIILNAKSIGRAQ